MKHAGGKGIQQPLLEQSKTNHHQMEDFVQISTLTKEMHSLRFILLSVLNHSGQAGVNQQHYKYQRCLKPSVCVGGVGWGGGY